MVSDKKNTPRKAAPNPKANSCILGITYLMAGTPSKKFAT